MYLFILKSISLVVILLSTLACSFLPILVLRRLDGSLNNRHKTIISLCNCFGGGIFMAMCFLGLLPYAEEKFASLNLEGGLKGFPFAQFIAVLGFLGTFTLEVCAHGRHEHSHDPEMESIMYSALDENSDEEPRKGVHASGNWLVNAGKPEEQGLTNEEFHTHDLGEMIAKENGLRLVVLIVAVSIHSLFEGLALGLLSDNKQVIQMLVAIVVHESIIAVALGIRIGQQNHSCCVMVRNVLMFTLTIPIGIVIGMGLGNLSGRAHDIVSGVLQALAAGVFLHVTFFEILPTELKSHSYKALKIALIFLGVLSLMLLKIILND